MSNYKNWNPKELRRWEAELKEAIARWDACRQQKPGDQYYEGMHAQTTKELEKVQANLERTGHG